MCKLHCTLSFLCLQGRQRQRACCSTSTKDEGGMQYFVMYTFSWVNEGTDGADALVQESQYLHTCIHIPLEALSNCKGVVDTAKNMFTDRQRITAEA